MACKADWEGGLEEFIFGYGVNPEDAPDDEVKALLIEILKASGPLSQLSELLGECGDE
jgi:hypothetical protein